MKNYFLQILEAMPNPIWRAGTDAKCDYFNKAWLTFTGRSIEQELGDGWTEGVHPEDFDRCFKTYLDAFNKREPFVMEYRLKHRSGGYHWLLDYGNPFYDIDGNFSGYLGSCYDIQDHKRSEEAIIRAKKDWEHTFDAMPDLVMLLDKDFTILRANKALADKLGKDVHELAGQRCYELLHESIRPFAGCPHKMLLANRKESSAEIYDEKLGGHFLITASPIYDDNGILIGAVHVAHDITSIKQTERSLKNALEEAQRRTIENASIHEATRAVLMNYKFAEAAKTIFNFCKEVIGATAGYVALLSKDGSENEVLFLDSGDLPCTVDPALPMPIRGLRAEAYKTGRPVYDNAFSESKWMKFMPDGHVALENVMFIPLIVDGITVGLLGLSNKHGGFNTHDVYMGMAFGDIASIALRNSTMFEDLEISKQKLSEKNEELEVSYADLKAAQSQILQQEKMASIGQLAAGVAHEINNPVGFIMSNLHSLHRYSERLKDYMQAQTDAIDALTDSCERKAEILDALHQTRRKLKIDSILEDTNNLISESLEGTERVKKIVNDLKSFSRIDSAEEVMADINAGLASTINIVWNELKYKADVEKDFKELPLTKCNPGQLNQVFMNIIVNAAHAIEKHGTIAVRTWHDAGNIFVSISDTGNGISPENIKKIFEPFFTTKEVGKGTGLGLSIAYDIIKKHNGEITVQSEVGKGTTFTVKIPVVES